MKQYFTDTALLLMGDARVCAGEKMCREKWGTMKQHARVRREAGWMNMLRKADKYAADGHTSVFMRKARFA